MAELPPAAVAALPSLPRSAARLSTCVDFPGYLQLLQFSQPSARFPWLRSQPEPAQSAAEGSCEVCLNADLAGSSVLLPGYLRGSQGAQRQAHSGGLTARMAAGQGAQRGSVDGAAGAELLNSWELGHCPATPPSAPQILTVAAEAAAVGDNRQPTRTPAPQPLLLPPPPSASLHAVASEPQLQTEWSFGGNFQRARVQALAAAAASLGSVRYDKSATQAVSRSNRRSSSGSSPWARATIGPDVGGGCKGRGGGGGGAAGTCMSSAAASSHRIRTGRAQSAAATVWASLAALTARTLRAASARVPWQHATGDDPPGGPNTVPGGPPQAHGAVMRLSCSPRHASDPGAPDPSRQPFASGPSGSAGSPGRFGIGAALRNTPPPSDVAMPRSPSAPMFVGPIGTRDGAVDLDALAAAATSLSSSTLGPTVPPTIPAGGSGAASPASAAGERRGPAAACSTEGRQRQRQPRRSRLLRLCAEAMPWLRCGHADRAAPVSCTAPGPCGANNACMACSFTALESLPAGQPDGAGGRPFEAGGCGGNNNGAAELRLAPGAAVYRVRSTPALLGSGNRQMHTGSIATQGPLPTPSVDQLSTTACVADRGANGRASSGPPLPSAALMKRTRLGIIWPSTERPGLGFG